VNVVVIGLGSMGMRRIRLIQKFDPSINVFGVDINEHRRAKCEIERGIHTYNSVEEVLKHKNIDCAFICSDPLSHHKIINQCLSNGLHVFTELNLVTDGYEENLTLATSNKLVLFLSSTILYRDEVRYMKNLVANVKCPLNYMYHVGQYLPDWHPWEDYRDFFVSDKRSNGCRELFAVELPWLSDTFGDIVQIQALKDKMSSLELDYNDNYLVMIQHITGCKGLLAVDIVSRKAVRNLEVFGEELYLRWDGTPSGLFIYDYEKKEEINVRLYNDFEHLNDYNSTIIENAYFNEITAFFDAIIDAKSPVYSFEKDMAILKLIDRIEA